MKAVMLTPDEGRLDRRIAQEAASLSKVGWAVDIVSTVDPSLSYDDALPAGVRLLTGGRQRREPSAARIALRRVRRLTARIAPPIDRFVETFRYRMSDRAGAIADEHEPRLAASRYDLIVAHDAPVFPLGVRLKDQWACPLVCDLHEVFAEQDEFFTTETARTYWRSVERIGLTGADGILAVNDAVAAYARSTHAPAAPFAIAHNSVPYLEPRSLAGPSLRELYPIPAGSRILLFAGSLRPHKNIEELIEGFGLASLDGWVLALLGEGPLLADLERLVRSRRLTDRVFLGQRAEQARLIAVAASADAGLLPYQPAGLNHEVATPNKLFEYIQARLPIATSRLPMVEQIIAAHGNGGFVDFRSAATTAAGLRRFVERDLAEIAPAALEAAARQFSWETEEEQFLALIDGVSRRSQH